MDRQQIVEQTHLAFDFIEKLYLEVSYLIKEVEGLLAGEEEEFIIGRPSGYGVTTRGSTGLDTANVRQWPLRKLAVFFVPKANTQTARGQTSTSLQGAKVLYFRIMLDDKGLEEPIISFGVLYGLEKKSAAGKWPTKFEHLMAHIEYNDTRIFKNPGRIDFEDKRFRIRGKLLTAKLYDITDTEQIASRIIAPALELFRDLE